MRNEPICTLILSVNPMLFWNCLIDMGTQVLVPLKMVSNSDDFEHVLEYYDAFNKSSFIFIQPPY